MPTQAPADDTRPVLLQRQNAPMVVHCPDMAFDPAVQGISGPKGLTPLSTAGGGGTQCPTTKIGLNGEPFTTTSTDDTSD